MLGLARSVALRARRAPTGGKLRSRLRCSLWPDAGQPVTFSRSSCTTTACVIIRAGFCAFVQLGSLALGNARTQSPGRGLADTARRRQVARFDIPQGVRAKAPAPTGLRATECVESPAPARLGQAGGSLHLRRALVAGQCATVRMPCQRVCHALAPRGCLGQPCAERRALGARASYCELKRSQWYTGLQLLLPRTGSEGRRQGVLGQRQGLRDTTVMRRACPAYGLQRTRRAKLRAACLSKPRFAAPLPSRLQPFGLQGTGTRANRSSDLRAPVLAGYGLRAGPTLPNPTAKPEPNGPP